MKTIIIFSLSFIFLVVALMLKRQSKKPANTDVKKPVNSTSKKPKTTATSQAQRDFSNKLQACVDHDGDKYFLSAALKAGEKTPFILLFINNLPAIYNGVIKLIDGKLEFDQTDLIYLLPDASEYEILGKLYLDDSKLICENSNISFDL